MKRTNYRMDRESAASVCGWQTMEMARKYTEKRRKARVVIARFDSLKKRRKGTK